MAPRRSTAHPSVGALLRGWRHRRHLSQLDLAVQASVSARHLSFVETGRAKPSRELVLHLAEELDVPLRERNALLLAAGYAPAYAETDLDAPRMQPVRDALDRILRGHEPFPAVVIDRHWGLVAANDATRVLIEGVAPHLLEPPINVLRLTLHPEGMAPRIANLGEWSHHLLDRLQRQHVLTGDDALASLLDELRGYVAHVDGVGTNGDEASMLAVPLRFVDNSGRHLAFVSTVTTFGTAVDITLADLAVEAFFPADADTADALLSSRTVSTPA